MIATQKLHVDPQTLGTIGNLRFQKKSEKGIPYSTYLFLTTYSLFGF